MLFLILTIIQAGLTVATSKSSASGWLQPAVGRPSEENVDPNISDLQDFSPRSSYIDLKFSWLQKRNKRNVNFVVMTFLYSSEGTYIGRTAVYYYIRKGILKRHSLRLFNRRSRCFDDRTLRNLRTHVADTVSWAVLGDSEPLAMVNGNTPAKYLQRCGRAWKSAIRQGEVSKVRVAVHNFYRQNLDDSVKIEWQIRSQQNIIPEWTSIFNSTTKRYDIGDFHVKFTQHKQADKYLYLNQAIMLHNSKGIKLGHTNLIFYLNPKDGKVEFSGYKRFYVGDYDEICDIKIDFPYLDDADFEMITSVKSADMFQFKVSGELHKENMGDCDSFGDWMEAMRQASKMSMTLTTWVKDLPDYFSTEYKVVN